MGSIPVSSRSKAIAALLDEARQGALIFRDADGWEHVLAGIDDFDREIQLSRKDPALMQFLDERGRQPSILRLDEVKATLGIH